MADVLVCTGDRIEISGIPNEIKILPFGMVHSQKGDFLVDDESFNLIYKQFKERRLDLVIDYEHQTMENVQAPAGGWIKDLTKGADAVIAKVEWTPKAREYLSNKEYRYLSPVVLVRKKDQKVTTIHSVALTNTPAIDGMFAIVNSIDLDNDDKGGNKMDLEKLRKLLGLLETATEEEILKALADAVAAQEQVKKLDSDEEKKPAGNETEQVANSTILSLLELKEGAKTEEVAAAIMTLKAGDTGIREEFYKLKKSLQEKNVDELVTKALKDGKITAAQKDWARSYALKDEDGFRNFMDKAPAVVPKGKLDLKDAPNTDQEVDMAILKALGISREDYLKYGKREE